MSDKLSEWMSKASKRPWKISIIDGMVEINCGKEPLLDIYSPYQNDEMGEANSKLICLMRNHFEALVEALTKIRDIDPEKDTKEGTYDEWGEAEAFNIAKGIAQAVLASLEEEIQHE